MKNSTLEIIGDLYKLHEDLIICHEDIIKCIKAMYNCAINQKKILICGNGGSASDSLHIVGELMKAFNQHREMEQKTYKKLKELFPDDANNFYSEIEGSIEAYSLVNETSLITAFSNDKDYKYVFAQQVYGYGKEKDILLAISTSGNAVSVVLACKMAKAKGLKTIGLTGENGGLLSELCDITIKVPRTLVYQIQELHLPVYHTICLALENELFSKDDI